MTLTIDLTLEEETRLEKAKALGIDVNALLKEVIHALPIAPQSPSNATKALFAQWAKEDGEMTPDELAAEMADWDAFKNGMNRLRAETGERPLYRIS